MSQERPATGRHVKLANCQLTKGVPLSFCCHIYQDFETFETIGELTFKLMREGEREREREREISTPLASLVNKLKRLYNDSSI